MSESICPDCGCPYNGENPCNRCDCHPEEESWKDEIYNVLFLPDQDCKCKKCIDSEEKYLDYSSPGV